MGDPSGEACTRQYITTKRDAARHGAVRTRGPSHPVYDRTADVCPSVRRLPGPSMMCVCVYIYMVRSLLFFVIIAIVVSHL